MAESLDKIEIIPGKKAVKERALSGWLDLPKGLLDKKKPGYHHLGRGTGGRVVLKKKEREKLVPRILRYKRGGKHQGLMESESAKKMRFFDNLQRPRSLENFYASVKGEVVCRGGRGRTLICQKKRKPGGGAARRQNSLTARDFRQKKNGSAKEGFRHERARSRPGKGGKKGQRRFPI